MEKYSDLYEIANSGLYLICSVEGYVGTEGPFASILPFFSAPCKSNLEVKVNFAVEIRYAEESTDLEYFLGDVCLNSVIVLHVFLIYQFVSVNSVTLVHP